jgi:type IV fimbrial biogenesis protein FimT
MDVAITGRRRFAVRARSAIARCGGFTLLELLVVMALLVVTTTAAVPLARHLTSDTRVTTAANQFLTALNAARQLAIQRDRRAVLCPSTDGQNCLNAPYWHRGWILFVDRNANRRPDAGETIVRRHASVPGVILASTSGRKKIAFRYDGAAYGSNATFRLCARGEPETALAIVLNNPGRARVARRDDITCPQP